ncbi:MAG: hypothetical protein ACXAEN_26960, partial [Candidatus Thorarchaeota archaeon]
MGILRQKLYPGSKYHGADDPHLAQFQNKDEFQENIDKGIGPTDSRHRLYPIGRSCGENPKGKNPGDTYEGKFNGKEDAEKFGSPRARTQRKNELSGLRTREKLAWGIGRDEQLAHPLGKNPSDFFKSNTKPYP